MDTVQELLATIRELEAEMDAPDLTADTEAQIVEAMELAEAQLDRLGFAFDGTPYAEFGDSRADRELIAATQCLALPAPTARPLLAG
jgi:hypothetical protein